MRNETEWSYLPLSEERVVAQQIKQRSRQDASFQAKCTDGSFIGSQGGFDVAEAVLCTYIDLDRQIACCSLPKGQQNIVQMQMGGYSLRDVAEMTEADLERTEREFRNAVSRIVRQNRVQWDVVYARKGCSDGK